jgi:hypothetical protein
VLLYYMFLECADLSDVNKCLVITLDDDSAMEVAAYLRCEQDLDATAILVEHLEDERPEFVRKMRQFGSGLFKALCMPFVVWLKLRDDLEYYIHDVNALLICDMENEFTLVCVNWIRDAQSRGFTIRENFLIHLVERDDQG